MGRRAKSPKGKANTERPLASKSPKIEGARVRDLEKRLAEALKREAEAQQQQTATAEILRVISSSPTDVQPVFEAVAASAARLCDAFDAAIFRVDERALRLAAHEGPIPAHPIGHGPSLTRGTPPGRAVLDRQTIHIADVLAEADEYPEGSALARRFGHRTVLNVPLLCAGEAIGAISLRRTEVRPFTDRQVALLKTFADQAVIAIENVRLFNETKEALEQQMATSEILGVISSSPTDIQPVLDAVVESAARLCESVDCNLLRLHGDRLVLAARHGPPGGETVGAFSLPIVRGTVGGRTVLERSAVHIVDLLAEADEYPQAQDNARRYGFRTMLSVPLIRDGAATGVIQVRRTDVRRFTDRQVALLNTFTDQAVIAIENVRLFTELETRNRDLTESLAQQTATGAVLKAISRATFDLQPVLDTLIESATRLCGAATKGFIFRRDGELYRGVADYGARPEHRDYIHRTPVAVGRGTVVGRVALEGRTIHFPDILADPDYQWSEAQRIAGFRTVLGVPMLREGAPIGVFFIWREEARPFTDKQIELATTFADQAVIAIENVRLFTELEARNRQLTETLGQQIATSEILRVISSSPTDIQPVFAAVVASAARLCDAFDATIVQVDGDRLRLVAHEGAIPSYPIGQGPPLVRGSRLGRAVLDRRTIHDADAQAETDDYPEGRAEARRFGHRTVLVVPLLRAGAALGAIAVRRTEVRPFSDRQVELLQTFADQAVIAVENVRLFTELQARNRDVTEALERQTATAEVLQVISASPTGLEPVFQAILQRAVSLCDALFGVIYRFDGELIHIVAQHNYTPDALAVLQSHFPSRPGSTTVTSRAILDRAVVEAEDASDETLSPAGSVAVARALGYRGIISVPMLRDGAPIGTITMARRERGRFTDKQIGLLKTFANQAVIAIENVRLFTESQEKNRALMETHARVTEALEQQTATSEILRVIASSPTDVQPVFDTILASATTLLGGFVASITRRVSDDVHMAAFTSMGESLDATVRQSYPVSIDSPNPHSIAIRCCEPHIIADADTQPDIPEPVRRMARARGWRSNLVVPLRRTGTAIGALAVSRRDARGFTPDEVALLQTFADQAVIAIENVRLFTALEARNRDLTESLERQTATAEILKAISQAHTDAQPVFEAIADSAMRLLGAWSVLVHRCDGELARLAAARGGHPGSNEAIMARQGAQWWPPVEGSMLGRLLLTRTLQHIADVETDPLWGAQVREQARERGWRSAIQVPMLRGGDIVGGIAISRAQAGAFSPSEIALLQTFADQAVIAVENARLLTELHERTGQLQRSVGQLTALGEVGQAVSSSLDLETVLTTIVTRAVQLTGVDGGSVYEYDEVAGEFAHRAGTQTGALAQAQRLLRIRKGEGVIGRTAVTHEPVQVVDITQAGGYDSRLRGLLLDAGVRALLAVPMLREGRLLGGLVLNRNQPGEFPPETVALLRTFATQSALAIQNARLYRELADQGRQLEVASRHKSEFLASMSHELRTPLNGILGFNEMILGDIYGEVPPELREPLTEMQSSGRHLLRLINNVLDLSKIEAGRMELALGDYSVQDTVAQVRASLQSLAADKGLEFVTAVPADLPLAHGDAGRITQCLTNLAGNAIKFTRAGRVEIGAELQQELLVYRVSDTGIGIEPDRIGSLFTEFRQADATIASEFGGSGLGLSITRKFAEMHGGRVWVESEPGKGSRFFLAVPLRVRAGAPA